MASHQPILVLAGPTASGKSALALKLAIEFGGEIINADSMQVYQELSIVTARPSKDDEAQVPHHLFGVLPPSERCSVGRWVELAIEAIKLVRNQNKLPILVGGTGMYIKALTEGLASIPDVPNDFTETAEKLFKEQGGDLFRENLGKLDSEAAARLPATDVQRLIRAWAVVTATGKTLSEWHKEQSPGPAIEGDFFIITLIPERQTLYKRINERFEFMIDNGAEEEVRALLAQNLDPTLPAMKALGVPEIGRFIRDECTREEAVTKAQQTSRNYAKRQLTWLRNQVVANSALSPPLTTQAHNTLFDDIRQFLSRL